MGVAGAVFLVLITILREHMAFPLELRWKLTSNTVPPVGVLIVAGCGPDFWINLCLTLLGCVFSSACTSHCTSFPYQRNRSCFLTTTTGSFGFSILCSRSRLTQWTIVISPVTFTPSISNTATTSARKAVPQGELLVFTAIASTLLLDKVMALLPSLLVLSNKSVIDVEGYAIRWEGNLLRLGQPIWCEGSSLQYWFMILGCNGKNGILIPVCF